MKEEIKRWSDQANADLKSAKNSLKSKDYYLEAFKRNAVVGKINKFKKRLLYSIQIDKMILFGSMAKRKGHKDSDIDLIIVSNKFKGKKSFKRSLGFYKYWDLDYPVDFLCYTPEEFNKLKKQITLVREAVKEGIEI